MHSALLGVPQSSKPVLIDDSTLVSETASISIHRNDFQLQRHHLQSKQVDLDATYHAYHARMMEFPPAGGWSRDTGIDGTHYMVNITRYCRSVRWFQWL